MNKLFKINNINKTPKKIDINDGFSQNRNIFRSTIRISKVLIKIHWDFTGNILFFTKL